MKLEQSERTKPVAQDHAARRAGLIEEGDRWAVALMLAVKALVLVFGVLAYTIFQDRSLAASEWLTIWNHWDAPHYLDIAREGYVSTGEQSQWIVFFPLYPGLVRLTATILFKDYLLSAFFVSALASVAAAVFLRRLAALDEDKTVARGAVFFLCIFPTSYFLHIGYTESLFLALALGSFLAARKRDWALAGVLGALASLSRLNGLMLVPALAVEAFEQFRSEGRQWRWEWLWIAFVGSGFVGYLLINAYVFGDPLAFHTVHNQRWKRELAWPWVGMVSSWSSLRWRSPELAQMVVWQEFFFVLLGLGCTVWCWLRMRASYAVWMTCHWLLWTSTKFILGVPRYTLVLFPIYILFARVAATRPFWGAVITVWSLLLLALFVIQFVQGRWAF
jgi:hypothetical protein